MVVNVNVVVLKIIYHWTLAIFPAPMNIFLLKYRYITHNINVINFDHVFVEYNIAPNVNGWIWHFMSAIYSVYKSETKMLLITKYDNIVVASINWNLLFSKTVFSLGKYNIECWLLIPNILYSMSVWQIHIMLI